MCHSDDPYGVFIAPVEIREWKSLEGDPTEHWVNSQTQRRVPAQQTRDSLAFSNKLITQT
jgi:hypothetical protein